jgi:hypothetical protein
MMTTQKLCSAAKLNFPADFGLDSNEARGAWSNHPSCVHFSLPVIASKCDVGNQKAWSMLAAIFYPFPSPFPHR